MDNSIASMPSPDGDVRSHNYDASEEESMMLDFADAFMSKEKYSSRSPTKTPRNSPHMSDSDSTANSSDTSTGPDHLSGNALQVSLNQFQFHSPGVSVSQIFGNQVCDDDVLEMKLSQLLLGSPVSSLGAEFDDRLLSPSFDVGPAVLASVLEESTLPLEEEMVVSLKEENMQLKQEAAVWKSEFDQLGQEKEEEVAVLNQAIEQLEFENERLRSAVDNADSFMEEFRCLEAENKQLKATIGNADERLRQIVLDQGAMNHL